MSDPNRPTTTFMTLTSADTDHSFGVPRLAGKTDLAPYCTNGVWIDPHETGLYADQSAQYCGTQHSKMLLRVCVHTPDEFARWIQEQSPLAHTVAGTKADGRVGPDLAHLMSRETIASGAVPNTPANLRQSIRNPAALKPGCRMPAMELSDQDVNAVATYLEKL